MWFFVLFVVLEVVIFWYKSGLYYLVPEVVIAGNSCSQWYCFLALLSIFDLFTIQVGTCIDQSARVCWPSFSLIMFLLFPVSLDLIVSLLLLLFSFVVLSILLLFYSILFFSILFYSILSLFFVFHFIFFIFCITILIASF